MPGKKIFPFLPPIRARGGAASKQAQQEADMWLKSLADEVVYIPRPERISIDLEVMARVHGSRRKVVLRNLTTQGARIDALEGLRYDDVVTLTLPGLKPKPAYVVWVKGESAGLAFERPLHPEIFATLVRKHGHLATPRDGGQKPAGEGSAGRERGALPLHLAA